MVTSGFVPETGLDLVLHERTARPSAMIETAETLPHAARIAGTSAEIITAPTLNITREGSRQPAVSGRS
jgi:hypothetical protein